MPHHATYSGFLSNVFLQPKWDGGFRMILNLKQFNKYVEYVHFKMETLMYILALVTPGCFTAVFDLKDAYLVVPIVGVHVKFLKLTWLGKTYMYIVLPFGLSSAPRNFTKLLKPILAHLCHQGIFIVMYIDDGWVKGHNFETCKQAVCMAMALFSKMDFIIHPEKSRPVPSQQVQILGFIINSVSMLITLPQDKLYSPFIILSHFWYFLSSIYLAQVIGIMISLLPACPLGRAHYRSLKMIKLVVLHCKGMDVVMSGSPSVVVCSENY